jgi:hypothetical protein
MKRNTTVLVVFGLLIVADLICLRLTLDGRDSLAALRASIAFVGQGLAAATFSAMGYLMLRKKYARQKKPVRRLTQSSLLQPLRRLFAAVLS